MLINQLNRALSCALVVCVMGAACNLSQPPRTQRQSGAEAGAEAGADGGAAAIPSTPESLPAAGAANPEKPRRIMGLKAMQGLTGDTIPAPISIQAARNAAEQQTNPQLSTMPSPPASTPPSAPSEPPLVPVPPAPTFKVSPIPVIVMPPTPTAPADPKTPRTTP